MRVSETAALLMTRVCVPVGSVTCRSSETPGAPAPTVRPAAAVGIVATARERLFPEAAPGPLASLQAVRSVPAPSAHMGIITRAIERSEDMRSVRRRGCKHGFGDANTRILGLSAGAHYEFGSKSRMRGATHIYGVVKRESQ